MSVSNRQTKIGVALVALAGVAYFVSDYWRGLALAIIGALCGPWLLRLIDWVMDMIDRIGDNLSRYLRVAMFSIWVGVTVHLVLDFWKQRQPSDFGRDDGILADFSGAAGSPARSGVGTQLSLFSDSAQNMGSSVRYERVDGQQAGSGYLRVHFELVSHDRPQPYVGVYWDLSFPPARPLDFSAFERLSARVRIGKSSFTSVGSVSFVLYSSNVVNPVYAFPRYTLPVHELTEDWVKVNANFAAFKRPDFFFDSPVELEPSRIYRVALLILGHPGSSVNGHVDFDDVRFEQVRGRVSLAKTGIPYGQDISHVFTPVLESISVLARHSHRRSFLPPTEETARSAGITFRAPGIASVDLALSRRFAVRDGDIDVWAEALNFLNANNFGIPVRMPGAPGFGRYVSTVTPARSIRISAQYSF